eukprot:m.745 g.745  ORF g.745 m.745 type:complete len:134 (+) comp654_c0_seq2:519-920(+)
MLASLKPFEDDVSHTIGEFLVANKPVGLSCVMYEIDGLGVPQEENGNEAYFCSQLYSGYVTQYLQGAFDEHSDLFGWLQDVCPSYSWKRSEDEKIIYGEKFALPINNLWGLGYHEAYDVVEVRVRVVCNDDIP